MNFRLLPKAENHTVMLKGTWRWLPNGDIAVKCPECGSLGVLDHVVAANGTVSPSLVCPATTCGFHEFVMLSGWKAAP